MNEHDRPQRRTEAQFVAYLDQPDVGPWEPIDGVTKAIGSQASEHHYWQVERTPYSTRGYAYEFVIHNGGDRETFFEHLRTGDYET